MHKPLKIRLIIGISLLELLLVIAIISMLASIGYPNYMKFKAETRREEAHAIVIDMYSTMQNFLIASNKPALQASDLVTLYTLPITSEHNYYSVNVAINSPNYTITATAINDQLNDLNCRRITIDNIGTKGSFNSANQISTGCW